VFIRRDRERLETLLIYLHPSPERTDE
jgi:hypothetical protein